MKTGCVVVGAGRGKRSGLSYNKIFYKLEGRSILNRTLDRLTASGEIDEIVLVLNPDDLDLYDELCKSEGQNPLISHITTGGATRRESVYAGLKLLSENCEIALIHDAARPFVTSEIIHNVIEDAVKFGSGVISRPIRDTVKRVNADGITATETVDREKLRTVQTPQAFNYKLILDAHKSIGSDAEVTDDAMLFELKYGEIHLTTAHSAAQNIKFTDAEDFKMYSMNETAQMRIGTGYDVHRLVEGRRLMLCGVEIPYDKGLLGHSDADVALHALMDAMLGAAALGDIGKHFPDSKAEFKDISSLILLEKANELLVTNGYCVSNCDITIVAQAPKLAPYIIEMRQSVANALNIDISYVSVKATTTEHLGFEGEGKGISAQSVVLIKKIAE